VKADQLRGVRASCALVVDSVHSKPDLDPELRCTAGAQTSGVNFECSELCLTQNTIVVQTSVLQTAVNAAIVRKTEEIRKLIGYQGNVPRWEKGSLDSSACLDRCRIRWRQCENPTLVI